jgi:DNA-binding HxlR family transcriptional regulator
VSPARWPSWRPLDAADHPRHLLRKRKYSQLLESLAVLSPNLLAAKRLEEHDILERRFYSDHPPGAGYFLTKKGLAFGKVLTAMKSWGEEWEPEAKPRRQRVRLAAIRCGDTRFCSFCSWP